jgi:hypothetical protein
MATQIRHDPYARECLMRVTRGAGKCDWCGSQRQRLFRYYFERDDSMRRTPLRRDDLNYCNISCMRAYHS